MAFTHLHVHSEYSLLDGACRIEPLVKKAAELGQTSLAITDHGVMYGAVSFYKTCKANGVKPIIGCEVYVASGSMHDKQGMAARERHHLILLCKNMEGYSNLIKMVSRSFTEGFYMKPRVDLDLLRKYSSGLIATSACLAGSVQSALLNNDYDRAKELALELDDIFGRGNFYLELQNHGLNEEVKILPNIIRISRETGIPLVCTNDVHYIEKEDSKTQKILVCIQTGHTIDEDTGLDFRTDEFYLKSEEEMQSLFGMVPEALENTQVIADACNVEFEFGVTKLPHFDVPEGLTHAEYLRNMAVAGLEKRYGSDVPESYVERMNYELSVVDSMGYTDYYLIVHDFVNYAKSKGIPVGPGRGSGAGSIVAYLVGITDIDPMQYNLLFERFLNPERVSMPDFDIDFCYERRPEVIEYVTQKYGADHVAQIVTFGTLAARQAIRDCGRVLGVPYAKVDAVTKQIPWRLGHNLSKAIDKSPEIKQLIESDSEIREMVQNALKIEGMPRHTSTHAAGVVITADAVDTYVPLSVKDDTTVTQYTMTELEELGLLKMDFLGLRTLTVIHDCEELIRRDDPNFSVDGIDYSDKETFKMLGRGETEGVFQFESTGLKSVMIQFKPDKLEDLIAITSLYRPGPMDSIPTYIRNRHNPSLVSYKTPQMEEILDVTYGCMVYQEQVMEICRKLAGYSFGHADIVRRAMSKKKKNVMEEERVSFVAGCKNNGISESVANSIFDDMISFASYAFNKSHAAAYATVAFRTAYLKCHYPAQYMASLITSFLGSTDKVVEYIAECGNLGIRVNPPHVNRSYERFTVENGDINFGLLAVKGLGRNIIADIVRERELNGEYTSFYTFVKRINTRNFNRKAVEALIKCGALDGLDLNRRQMISMLPEVLDELDSFKRKNVEGQMGLFDMMGEKEAETRGIVIPQVEEFSGADLLAFEKETTGLYISGHPMQGYSSLIDALKTPKIFELLSATEDGTSKYRDDDVVKVLVMLEDMHIRLTKSGSTMANTVIEDLTGSMEMTVFPKTYSACSRLLQEGKVILVTGRLAVKDEEKPRILATKIEECPTSAETAKPKQHKVNGLFLRFPSKDAPTMPKVATLLEIFAGGTNPVHFYFEDTGKYETQKQFGTIFVSDGLKRELKQLLGENNVFFR
ncbi:MAG: DNA polymerase III subunit alpha [Clostridia bacterium]|nr:DNA polymerase III subunit alpha [Clostridia bacterium]